MILPLFLYCKHNLTDVFAAVENGMSGFGFGDGKSFIDGRLDRARLNLRVDVADNSREDFCLYRRRS